MISNESIINPFFVHGTWKDRLIHETFGFSRAVIPLFFWVFLKHKAAAGHI